MTKEFTCERALMLVHEVLQRNDFEVTRMPDPFQVVHLISQLDFEIANGGVLQWLTNSSGRYCAKTVAALEAVGANVVAALLREVLSYFPDGNPAAADEERMLQVQARLPMVERAWRQLGDRILEWPDDVDRMLRDFVARHRADFDAEALR